MNNIRLKRKTIMKTKWWLLGQISLIFILYPSCEKEYDTSIPLKNAQSLIPIPASIQTETGSFTLTATTHIYVNPGTAEALATGGYLAERLSPATGFHLSVTPLPSQLAANSIVLTTAGADQSLGEEGYTLTVTKDNVIITALNQTGIFWGIQTLRQLFPSSIESSTSQSGPWKILELMIRDKPRFAWRGTMLDVARHFFVVDGIKRIIDEMAYYKLNRLHLHLTDDQGWRITIASWPNLTTVGGSTQVGGGAGGFYTQTQYTDIINYAQSRHIMIIPEIDMPGHCNAALASYADLNANGTAPQLYTGTGVGFSAMAVNKEITYTLVDDVVRELAEITPGPYIHLGGDEASTLSESDYVKFIQRVQTIVQTHGKQLVGWEEISQAELLPSTIAQHWYSNLALAAFSQGAKVIMSPASKTYLDMKYNSSTPLGQTWAGMIEVKDAYDWDPATEVNGIPESSILGVEAPLWTETIATIADAEFMMFPRVIGHAEIGWSPQAARNWSDYRRRFAYHVPRLTAMGVNFYHSSQM